MNFFKKAKKGFTLVELVVVIAVIAILAAVSVGAYFGVTESANNSKAEQEAKQAYTQLQTKTLAGLDLGTSGTSVTLGNKGLTFNGIYDSNILNLLGDLVFDQGVEIKVSSASESLAEIEATNTAQVYFFAAEEANKSATAKFMGYIPANLTGKYARYVELGTGELFTNDKMDFTTPTYKDEILGGLVKDVITLSSFGITGQMASYGAYGEFTSQTSGITYMGYGYSYKVADEHYVMQFNGVKSNNDTGLYTKNSVGKIKFVSAEFLDNEKSANSILAVNGNDLYAYNSTTTGNHNDTELGRLDVNNNFFSLPDNIYYLRLSAPKAGYYENITVYVEPGTIPSPKVSDVSFDINEKVSNTIGDTFKINATVLPEESANKSLTWSSDNESVATVDQEGNVTITGWGNANITATSNETATESATCSIRAYAIENYEAGLVTKLDDIVDLTNNNRFVITTTYTKNDTIYRRALNGVDVNNKYGTYFEIPEDKISATTFNYSNVDELIEVELVSVEKDRNENSLTNAYALKVCGTEKYLGLNASSGNQLGLCDYLYDEKVSNYVIFEISFNNGNAIIKNTLAQNTEKVIKFNYNTAPNPERFACYSTSYTACDIQLYRVDHSTDTSPESIVISAEKTYAEIGEQVTFSAASNPWFTSIPDTVVWSSSDTSVATIEDGILTAKDAGTTTIKAIAGTVESNEISFTVLGEEKNGYYLIDEESDLNNNDTIVIVAEGTTRAMKETVGKYTIDAIDIVKSNGSINFEERLDVAEIKIEKNDDGSFALKIAEKYLTASTSGSYTNLVLNDSITPEGSWNITFENNKAHITTVAEMTNGGDIRYHTQNKNFVCNPYDATYTYIEIYRLYGENTYIPHVHDFEGNNSIQFCECGAKNDNYVAPTPSDSFDTLNLDCSSASNQSSADTFMKKNYSSWSIEGKLGNCYAGYLGFGRSGDAASSIKSPSFAFASNFKLTAVIKGNGSSKVMTSTLTFTLIDEENNVVATGYANNSTVAPITPVDGTDTSYEIVFTFNEGKTIADATNLNISFAKETGNIGLKSLAASAI